VVESLLSQDDELSLSQYLDHVASTGTSDARELAMRLEGLDVGHISIGGVRRWLPIVGRFSFNARLAGVGDPARDAGVRATA
jgi:hypothetical protein